MEFKKKNHFVPKMYLRQWSEDRKRVHVYRLLVSSNKVPMWKLACIKGIARHEHLYTRIAGGDQSDEFERWIDTEFESPAGSALQSAAMGKKLSKEDWWVLVRFLAAQDIRTPARLLESLKRWHQTVPGMVQDITNAAVQKLEKGSAFHTLSQRAVPDYSDLLPIRISTQPDPEGNGGILKVETDIGRGYWLFQIKHLLSKTANILHEHRWSMMVPHEDVEWLTSDDPVIKLNFQSEAQFDFGGGWASPGSEILMPVGPRRLMYTKIGEKSFPREIQLDRRRSLLVNRVIAWHAHRMIFATCPHDGIAIVRPRHADPAMVNQERREWAEWAAEV